MGAFLAFVAFGVLALLPWAALRSLDAAAPAAGHAALLGHHGLWVAVTTITDLGSPLAVDVVSVVAIVTFVVLRRPAAAIAVAVARLGELATGAIFKATVQRPRPDLLPHLT